MFLFNKQYHLNDKITYLQEKEKSEENRECRKNYENE